MKLSTQEALDFGPNQSEGETLSHEDALNYGGGRLNHEQALNYQGEGQGAPASEMRSSFLPVPNASSIMRSLGEADQYLGGRIYQDAKEVPATILRGYAGGGQALAARQRSVLDRIDAQESVPPMDDIFGYADMSPEEKISFRQRYEAGLKTPVQESGLYKAGDAISNYGKPTFNKSMEQGTIGVLGDLAGGVGSVLGNVALGAIPIVGLPAAIPNAIAQGVGEGVQNAVDKKATPEQINQVALHPLTGVAGASEFIDNLIPMMGGTGRALGLLSKVPVKIVMAALAEGGQEGFQQFLQDLVAKGIYDPNRDVWADVPYSAFIGGLTGAAVRGVTAGHERKPDADAAPADAAMVNETVSTIADPNANTDFSSRGKVNIHTQFSEDGKIEPVETPLETKNDPGGLPVPEVTATMVARSIEGPLWVSKLVNVAQEKLPNVASAQQVRNTLRNQPGIKEEEWQAVKIDDFLAKSDGPVKKEDVIAHLEENQIKVEEVTKENVATTPSWNEIAATPARFEEYTLPGPREGYREHLLTLPEKPTPDSAFKLTHRRPDTFNPGAETYTFQTPNGERVIQAPDENTARQYARDLTKRENRQKTTPFVGKHFAEPNVVANIRSTDRIDHTGANVLMVEELQSDWHQKGREEGYRLGNEESQLEVLRKRRDALTANPNSNNEDIRRVLAEISAVRTRQEGVPDAPFKTSWAELAVKRTLRWAADNGHDRIAWTTGQQQIDRYPGLDERQKAGMREFYDRIVPSLMRKYAKRYGAQIGETQLEGATGPHVVPFIEVTPKMRSDVREGLPLFSRAAPGPAIIYRSDETALHQHYKDAEKIAGIINKLKTLFGIDMPIRIVFQPTIETTNALGEKALAWGLAEKLIDGTYTIRLALNRVNSAAIFATAAHEFGHIVMWEKFDALPASEKRYIRAAFEKYNEKNRGDTKWEQLIARRDNAIGLMLNANGHEGEWTGKTLNTLRPEEREYWAGFDEWFAEQVAKWATTAAKPRSLVDKTFAKLGKTLKELVEKFIEIAGAAGQQRLARPDAVVGAWLDSYTQGMPSLGAEVFAALDEQSRRENQSRISEDDSGAAPPQSPETQQLENLANRVGGKEGKELRKLRAYADHFRFIDRIFNNLFQVIERNPLLEPLRRYGEYVRAFKTDVSAIYDGALLIGKLWQKLRPEENERLVQFINDVTNLVYLTPEEREKGIRRQPTEDELASLRRQYKIKDNQWAVYSRINDFFSMFLEKTRQNALEGARRDIRDPNLLAAKLDEINLQINNLKKVPYFPFMRFGNHIVIVKNKAKHVVERVHLENRGIFNSIERKQNEVVRKLKEQYGPDFEVTADIIRDVGTPFIGMPEVLRNQIEEKLNLTDAQRHALGQLKFEVSPANSFQHRFQNKSYVAGYSLDFQRAFMKYAFHGARFYGRVKYAPLMQNAIADVDASVPTAANRNRRAAIRDYMDDHYREFISPHKDFVYPKAFFVLSTLAFVPSAALVNLTQIPIMTYPFLAGKFGGIGFGNVRAAKALTKAITNYRNFYKKAEYENATEFETKALNYGIQTGRLDQTLAMEIAGQSEADNLQTGMMVGSRAQRTFHKVMQTGMSMFDVAEKANRRITFMAALDLAMQHPNNKFMRETIPKYRIEIQKLMADGMSQTEANAIVVAGHVVEQTQFLQGEESRPLVLRGKLGTLFLYKRFIQGVLFTTLNNKKDVGTQYLIMIVLLAGVQGIPGFDDLEGILRALAWQIYDKDFKLSEWLREMLKGAVGKNGADFILHGLARNSFGIPLLLEALSPIPQQSLPRVDMSAALSGGTVLPFDFGKAFGPPTQGYKERLGEIALKGAGAPGSVMGGMYKALTSTDDPGEFKRWESGMFRFMRNMTKSYRTFSEGAETNAKGEKVLRYDVRSPRDAAEALGIAMGFTPTESRLYWDRTMAAAEAGKVVQLKRKMLLDQIWEAKQTGDKKEIQSVVSRIKEFNQDIKGSEFRGHAITDETIDRSQQTRATNKAMRELGTTTRKADQPIFQKMKELYPDTIDARRVR